MAQTLIFTYGLATNYTQAEEDTLAGTLTGQPYGYTVIYNTTLSITRIWDGNAFINNPVPIPLQIGTGTPDGTKFLRDDLVWTTVRIGIPFGLDGTYTTSSSAFAQLAFNLNVGNATDYSSGKTIIKCELLVDVNCDAGVTGEFDLYNYSDGVQVSNSVTAFNNTTFTNQKSIELEITGNKTYRVRLSRTTGTGNSKVYVRAATLLLRFA